MNTICKHSLKKQFGRAQDSANEINHFRYE